MVDPKDAKDLKESEEEGAPAVVGQLQVSDDLLDFTCFTKTKKCDGPKCEVEVEDCKLTPRQKAILERKMKQELEKEGKK